MRAKKRFGQNFLQDQTVVEQLVAAAELTPAETVVEVGAGRGALTTELAKQAGRVLAVELDDDLIPSLLEKMASFPNVEIIHGDILRLLTQLPTTNCQLPTKYKIVGSIPYQITSPLLHLILSKPPPSLVVLLVQKEVALKILAAPPRSNYLSNFVQSFADVKLVAVAPRTAFAPAPAVDGAIIKIKYQRSKIKVKAGDWSRFLHRGFAHPRQMLNKVFKKEVLARAEIDPRRRPGTLTPEEWSTLFWEEEKSL